MVALARMGAPFFAQLVHEGNLVAPLQEQLGRTSHCHHPPPPPPNVNFADQSGTIVWGGHSSGADVQCVQRS